MDKDASPFDRPFEILVKLCPADPTVGGYDSPECRWRCCDNPFYRRCTYNRFNG